MTEGRVAPSTLVFTVQNWETAQTVTGADDDVDDGDGGAGVAGDGRRLHAEHGDDADDRGGEHIERRRGDDQGARQPHGRAPNKMVTVSAEDPDNSRAEEDGTTLTVVDDDEKGLVFTPAAVVEVGEGARQASYTVHLNSEPTGPVTVALTTDGAVQASPETLTFTTTMGTTGSWDTAQTVTATVGSAVGADGYAAALSVAHAASGGDYGGGDGVSVAGATRIRIAGADTTTTATYGVAGR